MKHVKKSMFISTILMVVMLVAALSTATFAWYTSNNTAASTNTTVGAAQATDANIGIGFYVGASENTIEFFNLVDGGAGNLAPAIPTTYFHEYTTAANAAQNLSATYTTSTAVQAGGFIAGGVNSYDSRRVVQMTNAQVAKIVAQSAYVHDKDNNVLTNLQVGDEFNGNYEYIYKIPMYVYNNDVVVDAPAPIAAGDAITVANNVYTKLDAAIDGTCYKVERVFEVGSGAGAAATENDITNVTTVVTQFCANQLSRDANFTPTAGTYLVMYYAYGVTSYTTAAVTAVHEKAEEIGYAGETAATLNTAEHDIQAINVKNQAETYPASAIPTLRGISNIQYNADGFAYLYKTFAGGEQTYASVALDGFTFTKASIDNLGYFKANGGAATVGNFWSGNKTAYTYNEAAGSVGLIQGKAATTNQEPTNTFYVTNNGSNTVGTLTIELSVTGDNANLLRIAVFKNNVYYGTLAAADNAPTTFGTILAGSIASDMPTYRAHSSINLGSLASGVDNAAAFQLVAWFDGTGLNDTAAGKNCAFSINFTANN